MAFESAALTSDGSSLASFYATSLRCAIPPCRRCDAPCSAVAAMTLSFVRPGSCLESCRSCSLGICTGAGKTERAAGGQRGSVSPETGRRGKGTPAC